MMQAIVAILPPAIRVHFIKALYRKHGKKLQSMRSYFKDKFYIYEVDSNFIPSESIGWFVDYNYYFNWVNALSARAYKPKEGDTVIDIGAGLGEESLVFSKMVGNTGRVYSIEANPEAVKILKDVIHLNNLKNIVAYPYAIATENEQINLNVSDTSFLSGSINNNQKYNKVFPVEGKRMDTFIRENEITCIDLLKSNIEGAERYIIESLNDEINIVRNIAISCHDFRHKNEGNSFFKTRKLVETYLKDNHFEIICSETSSNGFTDWVYGTKKAL